MLDPESLRRMLNRANTHDYEDLLGKRYWTHRLYDRFELTRYRYKDVVNYDIEPKVLVLLKIRFRDRYWGFRIFYGSDSI
mgnify:CR=1 FL=1